MSGNYSVKFELVNDIPVLYVIGDMTSDADNEVVKAFNELREKYSPCQLIFNFTETNYINSAGLATLINIIQEMDKCSGTVIFTGLSSHFFKVMDIVGITEFIQIFDTNDEAIQSLTA